MRITRLEAWPVHLTLAEPYTIAYETVDSTTNVLVRLHTDSPLVGHGCAAPDLAVAGETPEGVLAVLENAGPLLANGDPTRPAALESKLREALGFQPAALAALDMALLDLLGKISGLPLWKLLGGSKEKVSTSVTIGILPERETVAQARSWVGQGFTFLKLKGGRDVEEDVTRVRAVRAAVGAGVKLAFDANQGYSPADALRFLAGCAGADLVFLEQPTPRDDRNMLGEVQRQTSVPVMADESLVTPGQALELAGRKLVRLFNVKLMKVGGIGAALRCAAIAGTAGIGVMAGCMDECALGIAAGLHFALARPEVWYADLDSHLALPDDPTAGAVLFRAGCLFPGDGPGLGFDPA